jgi:putative ATPase
VRDALQRRVPRYDKGGEEHYNIISAYHKALRGSDPQGALYWLARMIEGGEDPMYIARRTVRFAVEDVGLADPQALRIAIAARDAYHFLGSPRATSRWRSRGLPRDRPEVEPRLRGVEGGARAARETPGGAGAAAHPQRAHAADEGPRATGRGTSTPHAVPEAYTPTEYLPRRSRRRYYHPARSASSARSQAARWWRELRTARRRVRPARTSADTPNAASSAQARTGAAARGTARRARGRAPLWRWVSRPRRGTCLRVQPRATSDA